MSYSATDLALAERHVAEGEARSGRQSLLIARMRARGQETATAEQLLRNFEEVLEQMRTHLVAIRADQPN